MAADRLRRIAEQVYRVEDRYVNVYVLDLGKVVLVDTGTKKAGPTIRAGLREIGKEPEDVAVVLLTHHHVDHIGTAAAWKRDARAQVSISRVDAPAAAGRERRRTHGLTPGTKVVAALMGVFVPLTRTSPVAADQLLEGGEVLDVAGWPVEAIPAPGHTLGSCAYYARHAGLLFAGDAVNGRAGTAEPPVLAEDPAAARASYRKLVDLHAPVLLPGHGSPVRAARRPAAFRRAKLHIAHAVHRRGEPCPCSVPSTSATAGRR